MQVFTGEDLARVSRAPVVAAVREYLDATGRGHTHAPPRLRVPVGARTLVYTVGGDDERDLAGFRLYSIGDGRPEGDQPTQLVVALRQSTGELLAVGVGDDFGAWRTAALGAIAMGEATKHLDRPLRVAMLGAGYQAYHHARTWVATRPIAHVAVWARRPEAATAFAESLSADTGVESQGFPDTASAVRGADAVLGVTRSVVPVVEEGALPSDAYVGTVGPKFGGRHELPEALYASADTLFSDAPTQCERFEETAGPLPGGRTASEMLDLSRIVAGTLVLPTTGRRLFVSEGLAGSAVALLGALCE